MEFFKDWTMIYAAFLILLATTFAAESDSDPRCDVYFSFDTIMLNNKPAQISAHSPRTWLMSYGTFDYSDYLGEHNVVDYNPVLGFENRPAYVGASIEGDFVYVVRFTNGKSKVKQTIFIPLSDDHWCDYYGWDFNNSVIDYVLIQELILKKE